MSSQIVNGFQFLTDRNGDALDDGYVYIGVSGQDPELFPQACFFDDALTIPATQPLRTIAGYIVNPGAGNSQSDVFTATGFYSLRVKNKQMAQVEYKPVCRDALGVLSFSSGASLVGSDDGAGGSLWTTVAGFITYLRSSVGSSIVGFLQAGVGAIARTAQAKMREHISVKDFGAVGNGVANDTVAIQAAIDAVTTGNGGVLFFPAGTYLVSALTFTNANFRTIVFKGEGKKSSSIAKIAGTTTPLLTWNGVAVLDVYGGFEDIAFIGLTKTHDGIVISDCARLYFSRVLIQNCNVGLKVDSSLIFRMEDQTITANNIGIEMPTTTGPHTNLISITGGEFRANTTWAISIAGGMGVFMQGVDFEVNGTAANLNTGSVNIAATVDDESGYAVFSVRDCWFEGNLGENFKVAAANTTLSITSSFFLGNEGGRDANIGAIYNFVMEGCSAANGTVTVAAGGSSIKNSFLFALADTSSAREHTNVLTSTGNLNTRIANTFIGVQYNGTGVAFNNTAPVAKPAVTGSRAGNAALASALTQLASQGLITDSSTA